ncbi:MAG: hypothetical protein PF484_01630 [Bacteroidales bacterium]|jgi:Rieske Fe-S protein|nr:hypothetical protein [Bacteroidales bacterium]
MKAKTRLFSLFMIFLLLSCQKDSYSPLPQVDVNIQIFPNSTQYLDLNTVGGFVYLTANYPSRGIIVYRIDQSNFVAFERTCPHDPDECCDGDQCSRLIVDVESPFIISDPCCGSLYLILDGSNVNGPSQYPLKQYHTSFDGTSLRIYD